MPERDATLDAFIPPEPEETDDPAGTDDPTEIEDAAESDEGDAETPTADGTPDSPTDETSSPITDEEPVTGLAETTFAWSPAGATCEACGEEAGRRWRTDAGYVCHGCVDWERAPKR